MPELHFRLDDERQQFRQKFKGNTDREKEESMIDVLRKLGLPENAEITEIRDDTKTGKNTLTFHMPKGEIRVTVLVNSEENGVPANEASNDELADILTQVIVRGMEEAFSSLLGKSVKLPVSTTAPC